MENTNGAIIDHSDKPPFEFNQITEKIFLGTNACCTVHFDKSLLGKGIKGDISVELEKLDAAQGAEFFLWLPVEDHHAPTMVQLRVGTHTLRELVDSGEKVYVHCRNGHGRGPSLVIAYFILLGDDYNTAFEKVKTKRPVIHLDEEQVSRLMEFAKWIKEEHVKDAV